MYIYSGQVQPDSRLCLAFFVPFTQQVNQANIVNEMFCQIIFLLVYYCLRLFWSTEIGIKMLLFAHRRSRCKSLLFSKVKRMPSPAFTA